MKKQNAPGILRPWVATFAKWASIGIAVLGAGYGLTHGLSNITSMFEWASPNTSALELGGGVITHLAIPALVLGAGLAGYHVSKSAEKLSIDVAAEREMISRGKTPGIDTPSPSVMTERRGKPGKVATTAAALLGFSTIAGGVFALAPLVITMAMPAAPLLGALFIAGGAALAATAWYASNANTYANSPEAETARQQIITASPTLEKSRAPSLDIAMADTQRPRNSWASRIDAERASQQFNQEIRR